MNSKQRSPKLRCADCDKTKENFGKPGRTSAVRFAKIHERLDQKFKLEAFIAFNELKKQHENGLS